ncbi:MAG: CocE/NonD family hydrolase, partial [Desulfobacterales bacterium]|nr:CocE/NonD family hydrolase [Desulfobacterales bacterium]
MRDSIRCTIGSPWNLLANIPAVVRAMFDPQLGFGPRLARYGLSIFSISKHMPKPKNRVIMDKDMTIPMRDGVRLCCDIIRPEGEGSFPVLIIRHPYGRYLFSMPARQFALQGFAVVHVDERGRFGSEGDWYIFRNNEKDGQDLCEWINQQPWSDGQIGGWGSSMLGINQWFLALNNPLVTAIAPNMGCLDIQRFLHYGGAKPLSAIVLLGNWVANRKNSPMVNLARWMPPLYNALPISEIIHPSIGKLNWVEDMIAHDSLDAFFDYLPGEGKYASISAPSFSVTGWYDMLCDTMIHDFQKLQAANSEAGKKSRIVIGPWGHYCAPTINDLDEYIKYSGLETMRWYQYMFKNVKNGVEEWPPVRYYETGVNKWHSSEKWPPPGIKSFRLYMTGDGILSENKPTDTKPPNIFVYDPSNPVPTIGGDHLFFNVGRKDQAKLESRPDVLVYR